MKFHDKDLNRFLELRASVPISRGLEERIISFVAQGTNQQSLESMSIVAFIQDALSTLISVRYTYAFSGVLLVGLALGFINSVILSNFDYLPYAELFYHEESLL